MKYPFDVDEVILWLGVLPLLDCVCYFLLFFFFFFTVVVTGPLKLMWEQGL